MSAERRVSCALLAWHRFEWLCEACLRSPGLEVRALDAGLLGLDAGLLGLQGTHNPFGLPTVRRAEVLLISSIWCEWLVASQPERVEEIFARLEGCAEVLVGVESHDDLRLSLPPRAVARMACVLKGGGLYRDRELYNLAVGPRFPGGVWSQRRGLREDTCAPQDSRELRYAPQEPQKPRYAPRNPQELRYAPRDLQKLRLSIPCFLWVAPGARRSLRAARTDLSRVRRLTRNLAEGLLAPALAVAASGRRANDVHCVGRLTHVQRLQALHLLEGFSGHRGITEVPERVSGLPAAEPFWHGEPLAQSERLRLQRAARPYARAPVGRLAFQLELRRHRVVFAPTGHGELTYRHMEALAAGAVLVCQDLSHAETMFPFEDRRNVLFCSPDLCDLKSTVEEALLDERLRRSLGREGRRAYSAWARRWREHLSRGIDAPIREALGV